MDGPCEAPHPSPSAWHMLTGLTGEACTLQSQRRHADRQAHARTCNEVYIRKLAGRRSASRPPRSQLCRHSCVIRNRAVWTHSCCQDQQQVNNQASQLAICGAQAGHLLKNGQEECCSSPGTTGLRAAQAWLFPPARLPGLGGSANGRACWQPVGRSWYQASIPYLCLLPDVCASRCMRQAPLFAHHQKQHRRELHNQRQRF